MHGTKPSLSAQKPSSLLGLLGILAFVFGACALSKVRTPNDESGQPVRPQDTPEREAQSRESPLGRPLIVNSPTNSEKSDYGSRHKNPWWEKAAVIVAVFLFAANWFQGCQTKRAADAAKSAAATAEATLKASQRPWVKIKHRIVRPLAFDVPAQNGPVASMTVEDTLENVGQALALNVLSWEDILPIDQDLSLTTARIRQEQWCGTNRHPNPKALSGYILFPHDHFVQYSTVGPSMEIVTKAAKQIPGGMTALYGEVAFAFVGCVSYRSPVDSPDAPRHETGFIYRLGQIEPWGGMQPFIKPAGVASTLQLVEFPDGFSAD